MYYIKRKTKRMIAEQERKLKQIRKLLRKRTVYEGTQRERRKALLSLELAVESYKLNLEFILRRHFLEED